jgi:hypothetical protein
MYIYHKLVREFKGNQNFTLEAGQYAVREDDTTSIYKRDKHQTMREVKKALLAYALNSNAVAKISGTFPRYFIETHN